MNKMIKYSLLALAIGALAVSCADYNETTGFTAEPDPTVVEPYKDLKPVKSYIDRNRVALPVPQVQRLAASLLPYPFRTRSLPPSG